MAGPYNSDGTGTANNYVPPPPIESKFPTIGTSGNLSVDPTTLKQVAKAMEQDIATLQSTLNNIQSNGLVTSVDLGYWDAASSLGAATGNAFSAISQFTNDLSTAHQAVIDRINQSAQSYSDTEANNVAAVSGVGAGGGGSASGSGGGGISTSPSPGSGGGAGGIGGAGGLGGGGGGAGSGGTGGGPGSLSGGGTPPPGGPGGPVVPGGPGGPGSPGVPGGSGGGGGGPIASPTPITRVPRPPITGPGEPAPGEPTPGEPAPGDPVPGEPVPGEPVPPEPVVGGPVIGGPGGGPGGAMEDPILGGRRAGVLGSLDPAEGQVFADEMANPSVIGSPAASEALVGEVPDAAAANAAAADAAGAEMAGGPGFMPMTGAGGAGQGEKERERGTWLAEDQGIWDSDDEATPPVIQSAR